MENYIRILTKILQYFSVFCPYLFIPNQVINMKMLILSIIALGFFIFYPYRVIAADISPDELRNFIQDRNEEKKSFILIDVRTSQEHQEGYIPGTDLNLPYDQIEKLSQFVNDKDKMIILYCRSGRRSGIAKDTLIKMGYKNVINAGGVKDWVKKGYKLETK